MEINEITIKAKLLVAREDSLGYIVYVFEDLDYRDPDFKYIMCTRFPNWDNVVFKEGETGFLHIKYIRAGIDKWFDGTNFIPYNYTNIQFIRFVPLSEKPEEESEMLV